MKRRNVLMVAIIGLTVLFAFTSCSIADTQKDNRYQEANNAAFNRSSFLTRMDDLKAINIAANYLKSIGETVEFQETYIEYHEAGKSAARLSIAGDETLEYSGDYLEVRLYNSEDPVNHPCEHCTVIYISREGKVLGQNKIFSDNPFPDEGSE